MNSRILYTCILLLSFTLSFAGRVEKTYHFTNPAITQHDSYKSVEFSNTMLSGLPGEPALPYQAVSLLLPPGEVAVSIEIIGSDPVQLKESILLPPVQMVRPVSQPGNHEWFQNNEVYNSVDSYPAQQGGKLLTSFLNGHSIALSTFTPVSYIPSSRQISYYSAVKVIIHTAPGAKAAQAMANLRTNENITSRLEKFCQNPELIGNYQHDTPTATDEYQVLVITPNTYVSAFESLKAAYLKEGLITRVATTESIDGAMTGLDLQEKIRNYIIQEYQQKGIDHVILAGDDELIPNRGFYCIVQSSSIYEDYGIPSDLYYSALDGNWNDNGDNKWGEPEEDDLLPDISVGRLSFSNQFELQRMLHKTYAYQFTPVPGEFQKVIMAGENLYSNPDTWGSDYLELLIGSKSDNGYTTIGIPESYTFNKMYDETTYWSGYDLISQLNLGYPMLHHSGHANETYVMKLSNWDITDANFSGMNGVDHNYCLVYTHGCLCGSFDFDDCIAEEMVSINNFAAAFVGNSRYGWFNEGQTEGPSAHLHREFLDALYSDKLNRLGRAHMESKIATSPWVTAPGQWEPGALRWCFYDCNVLGDPVMAVWTNDAISIVTSYPANLPTGSSSMNVSVTSAGFAVQGLACVMLMNGELIGQGITNDAGQACITFNSPLQNAGNAELVVSGYNCLPTAYAITVTGNTGVQDAEEATALQISPNPVNERLNLSFEQATDLSVLCWVVAGDGKTTTLNIEKTGSNDKSAFSADVSKLTPGVYQCYIQSGEQRLSTRFVKK